MALAPGDLARLSGLLETALELPEAARAAWLEALPAELAHLRPQLMQMLQAPLDGPTEGLLAGLPQLARQVAGRPQPPALEAGQPVGPYRLLWPLGQGGMGTVWLAERVDGSFKRNVALKLPFTGLPQARLAERFARERDILAALEHRHIARLYDAGVGADGQPYLALEHVLGRPITEHAQAAGLALRERVRLFQQVLDGVQYAHSRLVVHRDLKPSNILVTAEGQVMLLDFGIATLLAEPGGDTPLAEFGAAVLTPAYASPEQQAGQAIGTASDLYSLGVVLHELLTGRRPDAPGTGLPAELAAIVQRALQPDPARRYTGADAFAQDLQRWLDGAPVLAYPDSLAYRWRKFVGRYRLPVAALALAIVGLSVGLAVALQQARVARAQTQLAQRQAARAQAVQSFVVDLFNEADPVRAQGRELAVRDLLARGERTVRTRLGTEPDLNIAISGVMADIYHRLGDDPKALPLAEARAALALKVHGEASVEHGEALVSLGLAQAELQHYETALALLTRARAVLAAQPAANPVVLLQIEPAIASQLVNLRRLPEARATLQAVLPRLQAQFGAVGWEVVKARSALAITYADDDDFDAAAAIDREIEPLLDRVGPELALDVAELRGEIGQRYAKARRYADAERLLVPALAALDRLLGPNNSSSIWALETLADARLHAGQVARALESAQANAARAEVFYAKDLPNLGLTQSMLVVPLLLSGRLAEAERAGRQAVERSMQGERLGASLSQRVRRRAALALVLNGKADEALALLDRIAAEEAAQHIEDDRHALTLSYRAGALLALRRPAEAAVQAHEAARIYAGQKLPERLAKAWLTEGVALARLHDVDAAERAIGEAARLLDPALPPQHGDRQFVGWARAELLRAQGRGAQADAEWAAARQRFHAASGGELPAALPMPF